MPFKRLDHPITANSHSPPQKTREAIDLRAYHQHTISNAQLQFDEVETTLSHLFRRAHIALQNKTYAASLLDALTEHHFFTQPTQQKYSSQKPETAFCNK